MASLVVLHSGNLRAVPAVGLALQPRVDHSQRAAVAVVTAAVHVEVERVRLTAVAVVAFHVLRADAVAYEHHKCDSYCFKLVEKGHRK